MLRRFRLNFASNAATTDCMKPPRLGIARRFVSWTALSAIAAATPMIAQSSLEDYWKLVKNHRFQSRTVQGKLNIPEDVLAEYSSLSDSLWRISGGQGSFDLRAVEMLDPPGAFGLLTFWARERMSQQARPLAGLEAANFYDQGRLAIAKGAIFMVLTTIGGGDRSEESLASLGAGLASAIDQPDIAPVTVLNLPQESLIPESVSFYLGGRSFARQSRLPSELNSLIGFREGVELTTADYSTGESLHLIGYPTPAMATEALDRLGEPVRQAGLELRRSSVLLAISSPQSAALLDRVKYSPHVQWVKSKSPRSLEDDVVTIYGVFTSWVVFTVFFIGVAVSGGGLIWLIRIGIHSRVSYRPPNEMIRLGLDTRAP